MYESFSHWVRIAQTLGTKRPNSWVRIVQPGYERSRVRNVLHPVIHISRLLAIGIFTFSYVFDAYLRISLFLKGNGVLKCPHIWFLEF